MYARDHALIATPIGMIQVEGDDCVLTAIRIGADGAATRGHTVAVRAAVDQLSEYVAGARASFDLPLRAPATLRGQALRSGLIAVGYGLTLSYGDLAKQLGSGARAIGQLCARNPFPIIVPCHRIVGADGAIGSYSAGNGPSTKQWLLDHEQRHQNGDPE